MWTLQSTDPEHPVLTFRLLPGTQKTMGRSKRADFVVEAPLVSRVHCRFTLSVTGELVVEDLGTTNGTFVNGVKVLDARLAHGDTVKLGRVEFAVGREA